jgi:hypothetical protein
MVSLNVNRMATHRRRSLQGFGRLGIITPQNQGESILGATGVVSGTGASIGSVFGPIGTAVGAAVGAVAGGLIHFGTGAQRLATSNQILSELRALPAGYQGRVQTKPVLLEIYGAIVTTKNLYGWVQPPPSASPSDIQHEFDGYMDMIAKLIQATNAQPIGATVNFSYSGWNGVNWTFSFVNPGSCDSAKYTNLVVIPAAVTWNTHNGAVDVPQVTSDFNNTYVTLTFQLMTDWSIAQNPPPASQCAPAAPTTLLQQQPNQPQSSGPSTLYPAAGAPVPQTANTQPVQVLTTTAQGSPVVAPQDTTALMQQLIAQGQSQQAALQAAMASLQANNIPVTPQVQQQLQAAAPSGIDTNTMLLLGGGILAVVLLTRKKS